jgi:hypothetical protein
MRTLRRHFHQIQKLDVPRIPAANDGNNEDEDEDEDEQGEHRHDEEEEEEEEPIWTARPFGRACRRGWL